MTTTTTQTTKTMPRERGTLKDTLPKRPIIITLLVGITSAALTAQLMSYSLNGGSNELNEWSDGWWAYFGIAALGSMMSLVGVLLGDAISHSFVVGIVIIFLGTCLADIQASLRAAAPTLIFAILASIKPAQSITSTLATIVNHPILIQSVIAIQCLSFLLKSAVSNAQEFNLLPIFTVTLSTLALTFAYIKHRSHKNGCLLTSAMKSQSTISAICIILSYISTCHAFPKAGTALLSSSLFTVLFSVFFASVSDVWYAVGSGQFQMVSLDGVGMILYFIVPSVLLFDRFLERYGHTIGRYVELMVGGVFTALGLQIDGGDMFDNFVFVLSVTTAMGVAVINSLCPMGGYLFSRAYTHGQPNTKKVALCVQFSDLGADDIAKIEKSLEQTKSVLNIFVTLEDLKTCSNEIKGLAKRGHYIAISSSEQSGVMSSPTLFQGSRASGNIKAASDEYNTLFEKKPEWAFSGSSNALGRHPAYLRKAHNLGMKVAYWSTIVQVEGAVLTEDQKNFVMEDVFDKNGGSIVYITLGEGAMKGSISNVLPTIIDALKDFTIASLSNVVKDDSTMAL